MSPGGDHHALLGIDKVGIESVLDVSKRRSGIRQRSGGRAATFFVDGAYWFSEAAQGVTMLDSVMVDVKGVGTHVSADHTSSQRNTGLLNFSDALRELGMQRLIQRVADLEGDTWATVKTYGLLDTGLSYVDGHLNPATGWTNERCVLCLRQRHSRAFVNYEGYNFSGVLLMTGEAPPAASQMTGTGRSVRRTLMKYGISGELLPRILFHEQWANQVSDDALDDVSGQWNLQADAAVSRLMDFSDYYVLPDSVLPQAWRMSEVALRNALCLSGREVLQELLRHPSLSQRFFGTKDVAEAKKVHGRVLRELSQDSRIVQACSGFETPPCVDQTTAVRVVTGKPKYCQCWFMELDDSVFSKWALSCGDEGHLPLDQIDAWLPTARL